MDLPGRRRRARPPFASTRTHKWVPAGCHGQGAIHAARLGSRDRPARLGTWKASSASAWDRSAMPSSAACCPTATCSGPFGNDAPVRRAAPGVRRATRAQTPGVPSAAWAAGAPSTLGRATVRAPAGTRGSGRANFPLTYPMPSSFRKSEKYVRLSGLTCLFCQAGKPDVHRPFSSKV